MGYWHEISKPWSPLRSMSAHHSLEFDYGDQDRLILSGPARRRRARARGLQPNPCPPPVVNDPTAQHILDLRLCKEALKGSHEAKRELGSRIGCVPALVRTLESRLGIHLSDDEREEVVQNALTALWRKLSSFSGSSKLETWAYGFCLYELRKWREASRRHTSLRSEQAPEEVPTAFTYDAAPVEIEHVHENIERLGRPTSTVIRLRHFEGLAFEAIGLRLDIPANSAKTYYYRGMAKLRDLLRPIWKQEQP